MFKSDVNSATPRLAALDTLRGVAVMLVLGAHLPAPQGDTCIVLLIRAWQRIGWIGVDLFFVLSGYLVSGLLFRSWKEHGRLNAARFLMRRAWKIYPAFFAMLGLVLLYLHVRGLATAQDLVLAEALFVQNYFPPIFPHTWSLAVEEHFYLLLPLLLVVLRGSEARPFARLPAVCLLISILCLSLRIWTASNPATPIWKIYQPTHLRVDALLFGVVIAWCHHFHGPALAVFAQQRRKPLLLGAAIFAAPPFIWALGTQSEIATFGLTGLWLAAGILLIVKLHSPAQRGFLAWIGTYSYSIYIWHFPARLVLIPMLLVPEQRGGWVELAAYFGLSLVCGLLSAWLVEMPCIRLRDRLFPRR